MPMNLTPVERMCLDSMEALVRLDNFPQNKPSRFCRFVLLLFAVLVQLVGAMTAVVAVQVVAVPTGHWQSIVMADVAVGLSPFRRVASDQPRL